MNLLQETITVIESNGKSVDEVLWIGGDDCWFTWDHFTTISDQEYDSGFGGQKVASDLIVVGSGWWMSRGEYDGSEWWDFHQPITKDNREHSEPSNLFAEIGWSTVKRINQEGGEYA